MFNYLNINTKSQNNSIISKICPKIIWIFSIYIIFNYLLLYVFEFLIRFGKKIFGFGLFADILSKFPEFIN